MECSYEGIPAAVPTSEPPGAAVTLAPVFYHNNIIHLSVL